MAIIQQRDYTFSIHLKDAYLQIPIFKHHCNFLQFVCQDKDKLYQWKLLLLGSLQPPGFSNCSLSPYCSFAITVVCILLYPWMISRSLLTPSVLARELKISCTPFWFILDIVLIFPSQNSVSHSCFRFGPMLEYS